MIWNRHRVMSRMSQSLQLSILVFASVSLSASGQERGASGALEPTVSRKEAELLQRVAAVSTTNVTAAADLVMSVLTPESSAALDFALGNLHFRADRLPRAAEAYRAALQKLPGFRRAAMNLGRVYLMQGREGETINVYRDFVRDGRASADMLLLLAHALLLQDRAVSAESAYRQALLLRPDDFGGAIGLTKCLVLQERYREALVLAGEILGRDTRRKELWALRANAHIALDEPRKALFTLESARRVGQADNEMLSMLGDLYLNEGQPEEALGCYQASFGGDSPDSRRLLRACRGFVMTGRDKEARVLLARARSLLTADRESVAPADRRKVLRLEADLSRLEGNTQGAMASYRALLEEDPLDAGALIAVGDIHRERGALEDAVMSYERASRVEGSESRALVRQAQTEVERARYGRAVELLRAAQAFEERPEVARYLDQVQRLVR